MARDLFHQSNHLDIVVVLLVNCNPFIVKEQACLKIQSVANSKNKYKETLDIIQNLSAIAQENIASTEKAPALTKNKLLL